MPPLLPLLTLVACSDGAKDEGDSPAGPTIEPQRFGGSAYYAGDPHVHTGYSGDASAEDDALCPGCGVFDDVFTAAMDAGLSWMAIADHVNGYPANTASGFADELEAVLAASAPERGFITVPSAEVWFQAEGHDLGHKTLLLFGDDPTLADLSLADVQPVAGGGVEVGTCEAIWTWAEGLEDRFGPLLLVPHHPAGVQPMPTDWTCADEGRQPVVEVYSEHGSALDDGTDFDPPWAGLVARGTVETALDPEGLALKMGFIAGTDSHDTRPGDVCAPDLVRTDQPYGGGLTVIVLDEAATFDRSAILAALQARSVYGSSGPLVPLQIQWSDAAGALGSLGQDLSLPEGEDLTLTVSVPEEQASTVSSVEAVGPAGRWSAGLSGAATWTLTVPSEEVPAYLYVAVGIDGEAWYGAAGCEDGGDSAGEWLWSSPSWIRRAAG